MSYDDFLRNFSNIQFCNLTPDAFSEEVKKTNLKSNSTWKMVAFHGEWINGKSAGGCGQSNQSLFWTNPQFLVTLASPDSDNQNNKCTIIVSLMQKYTREKRMRFSQEDSYEEFIQFRIFKIKNTKDVEASIRNGTKLYANQLEKYATSEAYINRREITRRFLLPPGDYLIIPSCYDFGHECEFLLRVFTEKSIEGNNTLILTEDKKILNDNDIYFFKLVDEDQSFSSWVNLLSSDDSLASNAKPTHLASEDNQPLSAMNGMSGISNLVIKSGFLSNNESDVNNVENIKNFERELEIRKVIAKLENKKTVKEACNIM